MEEHYSSLLCLKGIGMVIVIFKEVWKLAKSVEIYNVLSDWVCMHAHYSR